MMDDEKYKIVFLNGFDGLCSIQNTEAEIPTFYNDLGYIEHIEPVCDLLNEQDMEIKELTKEKERYKLLSEIRDEAINNRILTIKEFINNCSDDAVKKELKNLFYSEVNEYDLAKENRELKNQNEKLKKELFEARKAYLIETADISDKLYLEDEIEKERKEIFGDNND